MLLGDVGAVRSYFTRGTVSMWNDEKVLEMHSGDGGIIL